MILKLQVVSNPLPKEIEAEINRIFLKRKIKNIFLIAPPDVDATLFKYNSTKPEKNYNYPIIGSQKIAPYFKKRCY